MQKRPKYFACSHDKGALPLVEKRTFNMPKLEKRASYMNRPADIWIP